MNNTTTENLLQIIKSVLNTQTISITGDIDWADLIKLAQKHGVMAYVYHYVKSYAEICLDNSTTSYLEKRYASEVFRNVLQMNAVEQLKGAFEKNNIISLFIKGAQTKKRYPNEILRSMGDIDFLYKAEQDKLLKTVMTDLGYKYESNGRVHDVYKKGESLIVEAHRELISPSSSYEQFGLGIWERVRKTSDNNSVCIMSLEDEIIFNIIHLASHFKKGGAGIRFVIDIWIYRQIEADWLYIESELTKLDLLLFYKKVLSVAEKWFGNIDITDDTITAMEQYIVYGGIFGDSANKSNAVVADGKIPYLKRVLFPPFKDMQSMFPWLKRKIMLPFAWGLRGVNSIISRRKNVKKLLGPVGKGKVEKGKELAAFYKECGL